MQLMPTPAQAPPFLPVIHAGQPDVDHPTKAAPDRGAKKPTKPSKPSKPSKKK